MSYYSSVRISTNKSGYDRLIELADLTNLPPYLTPVINIDDDSVILGWDDVKWYDWEGDVRTIMDALYTLRKEEYPYEFLRLGESDGDIESMGSNEELLDRHIEVSRHVDVWTDEYWFYRGEVKVTPEEVADELNLSGNVSSDDVLRWWFKNPTVKEYLNDRLHELAVRALADLYEE